MIMHVERRREWIKSRRDQRHLARTARLRRQFLRYMMLLVLLVIGSNAMVRLPWSISSTDTDLTVRGNLVTSRDQIAKKVASSVGKPLFAVDPRLLEASVAELPAVKHAFVRRYAFPHPHILVEVLEEFPWATYVPEKGKAPEAVISQSGRVIPLKDFPGIMRPPLQIYGPTALKMKGSDVTQWASWSNYISQQTKMPVESIDFTNPHEIIVENVEVHLKLGTADSSLTRRLGRLTSVISAIDPMKTKLEYIDLGLDNNIPLKLSKYDPVKEAERKKEREQLAGRASQQI
ncbi:MAG: FtsQ-type POTRA domain-containing protein [Leptolyngbya sp.]|nr:FtsQ-type POTRA domain-containing protein [Candidatus Melainabacteria bacterium]